jgi:hypothetical protein
MAETNGTGRLDRIEDSLETTTQRLNQLTEKFHLMVDHHDAEFKTLMTWQVLMQDRFEKLAAVQLAEQARLNTLSEKTDNRIAELVGAIGSLLASRPAS